MLTIAAVLGHKTLSMVKRYAHLSDQHQGEALARMNAMLFEQMSRQCPKTL